MSQEDKDWNITAQIGVYCGYDKKQWAINTINMGMDEAQKKYDKNPDLGAVVKSYEFIFKQ